MIVKKWKAWIQLLLCVVILLSVAAFIVFSPRFIFRSRIIASELNQAFQAGKGLDLSLDDVRIADYQGRWVSLYISLYIKLELTAEKYEEMKLRLLLFNGTVSNKDFSDLVADTASKYRFDYGDFRTWHRVLNNMKRICEFHSMDLDDFEEMLVQETYYGKRISLTEYTSGTRTYVLIKENSGSYFLYIMKL